MRKITVHTGFGSFVSIYIIAATFITKTIERTVTEQAVKVFRIAGPVAGKIFTLIVLEKFVFISHK